MTGWGREGRQGEKQEASRSSAAGAAGAAGRGATGLGGVGQFIPCVLQDMLPQQQRLGLRPRAGPRNKAVVSDGRRAKGETEAGVEAEASPHA